MRVFLLLCYALSFVFLTSLFPKVLSDKESIWLGISLSLNLIINRLPGYTKKINLLVKNQAYFFEKYNL